MKKFVHVFSKLFHPGDTLPLGRWMLKPQEKQLTSPTSDPGYWAKAPPGEARRKAIKAHLDKIQN